MRQGSISQIGMMLDVPHDHQATLLVMAGLVPAIHVLLCGAKDVDARHRAGHDDGE